MNTHSSMGHPMGGVTAPMPTSRYILPQFEERTSYGTKRLDPYTKLFEDRIIFLGVQVDDASANDIMAQLLVLESLDPDRDITMYINSPGGSLTAMTAVPSSRGSACALETPSAAASATARAAAAVIILAGSAARSST